MSYNVTLNIVPWLFFPGRESISSNSLFEILFSLLLLVVSLPWDTLSSCLCLPQSRERHTHNHLINYWLKPVKVTGCALRQSGLRARDTWNIKYYQSRGRVTFLLVKEKGHLNWCRERLVSCREGDNRVGGEADDVEMRGGEKYVREGEREKGKGQGKVRLREDYAYKCSQRVEVTSQRKFGVWMTEIYGEMRHKSHKWKKGVR